MACSTRPLKPILLRPLANRIIPCLLLLLAVLARAPRAGAQATTGPSLETRVSSQADRSAAFDLARLSGYFLSFVDSAQVSQNGFHYSELRLAYRLTPNVALAAKGAWMGPTTPTESYVPDYGDPEAGFDLVAPIARPAIGDSFALLAGTYAVLAGSQNSVNAPMKPSWKALGGFEWKVAGWSLTETNALTFYSYPAEERVAKSDPTMSLLECRLQAGRPVAFLKNVWWQNDFWYVRTEQTLAQPDQIARVASTLGYAWLPKLTTFAGLATDSHFGRPTDPPLFNAEGWVFRIGLFAPI